MSQRLPANEPDNIKDSHQYQYTQPFAEFILVTIGCLILVMFKAASHPEVEVERSLGTVWNGFGPREIAQNTYFSQLLCLYHGLSDAQT